MVNQSTNLLTHIIIISGSTLIVFIFLIIKKIINEKKKSQKAKKLHDRQRRNQAIRLKNWVEGINPDANPLFNPTQQDEDYTDSFFNHQNN